MHVKNFEDRSLAFESIDACVRLVKVAVMFTKRVTSLSMQTRLVADRAYQMEHANLDIRRLLILSVVTVAAAAGGFNVGLADENGISASQKLKNEQEAISGRFARFERVLSQMADMLGYDDPERAELLRRAISLGREQGISPALETISLDLERSEFGSAVEKQKAVTASLKGLLKLLQSEDRMSSVERERERLNNLLKDVNNVMLEERAARARAQNSEAPSSAAPAQQEAIRKTDKILDDIEKHDNPGKSDASSESESEAENSGANSAKSKSDKADGKPSDKAANAEDSDTEQAEAKNADTEESDKQSEGESKDDNSKPGKKSSEGQPSDSKPSDEQNSPKDGSESPSSENQSSSPKGDSESQQQSSNSGKQEQKEEDETEQTQGKENLSTAKKMMQEALDLLKEQKKEQAIAKQDDAISELQKAANELEKLLNQLREEEKEMTLAALEARFQRLLAMQTQIMGATSDLSATPRSEWLDNAINACRALSQQQNELTRECSYTTSLLREDGTSVSILLAVEDIEADMGKIAERLQQTKADTLTLSMETDVIEALKELVETTQREMAEMKQQQQQPPPSGQQQKQDLVDLMQEIKVLRSLQLRVNRRTRQVNDLIPEASSNDMADLQEQLVELASRQQRLADSAGELALKMKDSQ